MRKYQNDWTYMVYLSTWPDIDKQTDNPTTKPCKMCRVFSYREYPFTLDLSHVVFYTVFISTEESNYYTRICTTRLRFRAYFIFNFKFAQRYKMSLKAHSRCYIYLCSKLYIFYFINRKCNKVITSIERYYGAYV